MVVQTYFADIDTSGHPIVIITVKPVDTSLQEVDEFAETYKQVAKELQGPFVTVNDATQAVWINSKSRLEIGQKIR